MACGLPALLLLASLAAAADPPGSARVTLSWAYEGVPRGMRLAELAPGDWWLWRTEVVADRAEAPVGAEIAGQAVVMRPGETRKLALLYQNKTAKTVRFFAAPHAAVPLQGTLGFKFKCLCTNHVYTVPPGRWWYRVVELRLARGFSGKSLEIKHHLVAVDEERGKAFGGR